MSANTSSAAVEIRGVSRVYGSGEHKVVALSDVFVDIRENEFFTLLGPSGCGKTTLLRLIAGFDFPTKGEILLNGEDIAPLPPFKRPVNTVFQSYALFPHMTVEENIRFGLDMLGKPKSEAKARTDEMLELVHMTAMRGRAVSQISGGQQQRVALARALAPKPEVLLLDEPLSALDYKLRKEMQFELKRVQSETGITFIFVTHDQEEALTMSDRIAVLAHGKIQQLGKPEDLYRHPANLFAANFLGESNLFSVSVSSGFATLADGQTLPCHLATRKATLMIRPEALSLDAGEAGSLTFAGIVRESYYSGKDYTLEIEHPSLGTIQALVRAGGRTIEPGSTITLHAEPGQFHFIPEQA